LAQGGGEQRRVARELAMAMGNGGEDIFPCDMGIRMWAGSAHMSGTSGRLGDGGTVPAVECLDVGAVWSGTWARGQDGATRARSASAVAHGRARDGALAILARWAGLISGWSRTAAAGLAQLLLFQFQDHFPINFQSSEFENAKHDVPYAQKFPNMVNPQIVSIGSKFPFVPTTKSLWILNYEIQNKF
jgi:hypothetical protein